MHKKLNTEELKRMASQLRRDVIRMVHAAQSGHPGGSLGCADFFTALYFSVMDHNPDFQIEGKGEDVFILSNGHISPIFYATLARSGYFDTDELSTFREIDSRLQGHPATHEGLPGVRIASGSLGQGLSVALGIALSKRLNGDPKLVYCLTGDGELQEGQIWEALMAGPHHKIDNVVVTIDRNDKQIDGPTHKVMSLGNLEAKLLAFGWDVLKMDGNRLDDVLQTLQLAKERTGKGKPVVIIMETEMGYPVDFMMGSHKWHGIAPDDEQAESALSQLEETIGDY